jgi:hypothetical protein
MTASVFFGTSVDGFIARPNGDLDWLPLLTPIRLHQAPSPSLSPRIPLSAGRRLEKVLTTLSTLWSISIRHFFPYLWNVGDPVVPAGMTGSK